MKTENRLKKRKQFNWTFKNGTSFHSKDLVLVCTSSYAKEFKVGYSVTKKVGKAVVRNLVKRRLKNIVESYKNNIKGKHTLIFVAKQSASQAEFLDLKAQVLMLLIKADLFIEL